MKSVWHRIPTNSMSILPEFDYTTLAFEKITLDHVDICYKKKIENLLARPALIFYQINVIPFILLTIY